MKGPKAMKHFEMLLNHQKTQSHAICGTCMELKGIMLAKIHKKEREKYQIVLYICGI